MNTISIVDLEQSEMLELPEGKYKGQVQLSLKIPQGKGILNFKNGDKYEGMFDMGKPHGKGVLYFYSGDVYKGNMLRGFIEGEGEMEYANGYHYIGSFLKNRKDGKGKLTDDRGFIKEGIWDEDKFIA